MRSPRRAAVAVCIAALLGTFTISARQDTQPGEQIEVSAARTIARATSTYLVRMADEPVATYLGSHPQFRATKPPRGEKLNPNDPAVSSYAAFLDASHAEALSRVGGGRKLYDYRYALNGFAAALTPEQATRLAQTPGVVSVEPDEAAPLATITSPAFLGLTAAGGLWAQLGGVERAGEDIIIGVIDGGVWPEHPSYSDRTGSNNNTGAAGKLNYQQIPGWHGKCVPGEAFNASHCNHKLIGAQYFAAGRLANLPLPDYEYLSPRDWGGHGTHTSTTAAGNADVAVPSTAALMSGVAPRARIASYKVCFDDGTGEGTCFNSDAVAALDQAVIDGVDVINYSIGGTTSLFTHVVQVAFFNAAESGVFVAAAAGNNGAPGSVGHPSPWVTTVAATTHPRTGTTTLTLGNGSTFTGASIGTATPMLPIVLSSAAGLPGGNDQTTAFNEIDLCFPGTLDPAKVAGKMVFCDRGVNGRVEKSLAVALAGGVAMIHGNITAGSIDPDFHPVPTIHVSHTDTPLIKDYVNTAGASATGRLDAAVVTTSVPPGAPAAIAPFSSRGPSGGAGGDVLKPDLSAPGVSVLAGVAPPGSGGAFFALYEGTSTATPHIAGLAALLKQLHPDWSPMMIKSALMTTATQMVGPPNQAPLSAGAGLANPSAASDPGLVYDSSAPEWLAFVCGAGEIPAARCTAAGVTPIAPTDLNVPSIAVSKVTELPYNVSRRVTNVGGLVATYNATIAAPPGFTATVNPTALTLGPGETKSFTVTFRRTSGPFEFYQSGSLTWSNGTHNVRIPIVVRAVQMITTTSVTGSGASGSIRFNAFFGYTGVYTPAAHGLVADTRLSGSVDDDPNNSFDTTNPNGEPGATAHDIVVPGGSRLVRFALFDEFTDSGGKDDLDLVIYRLTGTGMILVGATGVPTSNETVTLIPLAAEATYRVFVHGFETDGPSANYMLFYWIVPEAASNMTVTGPGTVTPGSTHTIQVAWSGLTPGVKYFGTITHHRLPPPLPPGAPQITTQTMVFVDVPPATTAVREQ